MFNWISHWSKRITYRYQVRIYNELSNSLIDEVELEVKSIWEKIKETVTEAARILQEVSRKPKKVWFDKICLVAIYADYKCFKMKLLGKYTNR